jgi:hypothetical protein
MRSGGQAYRQGAYGHMQGAILQYVFGLCLATAAVTMGGDLISCC